jgi:amino acid permease
MQEAEQRLQEILGRAEKLGIPPKGLVRLGAVKKLLAKRRQSSQHAVFPVLAGILSVTLALIYYLGLHTHYGFSRAWLKWHQQDVYDQMVSTFVPWSIGFGFPCVCVYVYVYVSGKRIANERLCTK